MTRRLAAVLRRLADLLDQAEPAAPAKGRGLDMPRQSPVEQIVNTMKPLAFESALGDVKPRPDRAAQLPGRGFYDWRGGMYL